MGIALLRSRLEDPLSHIPSPAMGTADELRVLGNFFLAMALQIMFHRDSLAGMPEDDELVHVLRQASEGMMPYNEDKGSQFSALEMLSSHLTRRDQAMDAILTYERLITVLRQLDKEQPNHTFRGLSGPDPKTPLAHIFPALQGLAGAYVDVHQPLNAERVMKEVFEVLETLEGQGCADITMHVTAFCLRAEFMEAAGMSGSGAYAK